VPADRSDLNLSGHTLNNRRLDDGLAVVRRQLRFGIWIFDPIGAGVIFHM
jgi:hypothetical protein